MSDDIGLNTSPPDMSGVQRKMIISHKHKFIFVKTRKTAGTSLEIGLSEHCGAQDVITPISPKDELLRASLGFRGVQHHQLPFPPLLGGH